jgi:predicted PurR-regulated permease PerM
MEIVAYFILGMVTILTIIGIVFIVKVVGQISRVIERLTYIEFNISNNQDHLHRRVDDEIFKLTSYIREVQSNLDETEKDIVSMVDSRLDKLENRITSKIPPTHQEVLNELKELKEQFLTLRKNL